jgi:hypothetical protein
MEEEDLRLLPGDQREGLLESMLGVYREIGRDKGRCFRAVDAMSDGSPKLIAIDEQPNHHVVHVLCLRKADCPAY